MNEEWTNERALEVYLKVFPDDHSAPDERRDGIIADEMKAVKSAYNLAKSSEVMLWWDCTHLEINEKVCRGNARRIRRFK